MPIETVPGTLSRKQIKINDTFWSAYEKLIRNVTIPYQWNILSDAEQTGEPSHSIRNFRIAAGLEKGEFYGFVFQDSDVAKWLEAVSYSLENHPDAKLESLADQTIDLIGRAQQPDGYLDTYFIIQEPEKRWTNLYQGHELYCAGHMIEAGVAYFEATGKRELLSIVCRLADHIATVFGPEPQKKKGYPGHQEIELALIRLYRVTTNKTYLNLSSYFISQRGSEPYYFDTEWKERSGASMSRFGSSDRPGENRNYNQTHLPPADQTAATGHAVRAVYMYSAMADLAKETEDETLKNACQKLWNNIMTKQLYLTGGIGSTHMGEAFTFDYNLPNDTVYAETCASVGLIFFARRMLLLETKSCYADVLETALYNTVISSMAQDGKHFFYVNPLEVWPEACEKDPEKFHVKAERQAWFGCACCPPNVVRLIESLSSYIYTFQQNCLAVHLYIGSTVSFKTGMNPVNLSMNTGYPWNGTVTIDINSEAPSEFILALRYPGWCRHAELSVNGQLLPISGHLQDGYIRLKRIWQKNDRIQFTMDMPVQLISANPKVRADAGKAAIQRGPIVYCLEEADNGQNLSALSLSENSNFSERYDKTFLGGAVLLSGTASRTDETGWNNSLYQPFIPSEKETKIQAVPYFLWGNRGKGEMQIWTRYR